MEPSRETLASKRKRETPLLPPDLYMIAKKIQNCSGQEQQSTMMEDFCFFTFFGVGATAVIFAWQLLDELGKMPKSGAIIHLL